MATTRVTRHINAPRPDVYRALIEPESVQRWMVPDGMSSTVDEFDATVGGAFRISLTYDDPAAVGKTGGATDTFHGTFVKLVPFVRVVQSIEFESDDPTMQGEMRVTYTLTDASDDGTDVVGLHDGLPPGVRPEDNELGWTLSFDKLAALLEAPPTC
jgi:uncharacterized protein YndB with AHSA1/START domain